MAFVNNEGQYISYDCSDLIEDLEEDIQSGYKGKVIAYFLWLKGIKVYQDYDLLFDESEKYYLTENIKIKYDGYDEININDFIGILHKANSVID